MGGQRVVALVEITTATFWYNVDEKHCRFSINFANTGWRETGVPSGYYSSNAYLIDLLNKRAEDIAPNIGMWEHYNIYERKVFFDIPEGFRVTIPTGLAHILGFQDETIPTRDIDLYPKREVDLNHGAHALFIHVYAITPQHAGNAEVPLLRTVRMKSFTDGD